MWFWVKRAPHSSHTKGFSPVWILQGKRKCWNSRMSLSLIPIDPYCWINTHIQKCYSKSGFFRVKCSQIQKILSRLWRQILRDVRESFSGGWDGCSSWRGKSTWQNISPRMRNPHHRLPPHPNQGSAEFPLSKIPERALGTEKNQVETLREDFFPHKNVSV